MGGFGDAEVFSFHATKFLNSFEGGAVVTNNDALAAKLRLMRNFGFTGYDTVEHIGMNAKMPEVCAAMGLTGLESVGDFIATNRRNHSAYKEQLADLPGVRFVSGDEGERNNHQYVVIEIDPAQCPLNRNELLQRPARGRHPRATLLFPGLPSHGAVSHAVSRGRGHPAAHGAGSRKGHRAPDWRRRGLARDRAGRDHHPLGTSTGAAVREVLSRRDSIGSSARAWLCRLVRLAR